MILFVWILIFALPLLFSDSNDGIEWNHISKIWTEYLFLFFIFLLNRFVFVPKFFFKNKKAHYFTSLIISFSTLVIALIFYGQFEMKSRHRFEPPSNNVELPMPPPGGMKKETIPPFANLLILGILLIGFDTGLLISVKWLQLEQNKLQLEKENVTTKMAFLQNQISPHFFMNTLNNIHSLVDINTEDAKDTIIKLSRLMGYVLYETQTEKVSLEKEMNFVRSFVDLMKIRFTEDIKIELNIPDTIPAASIPSLLTISYIENAFKHGISYEENSFIKIDFKFTANRMNFEISNTNHNKNKSNENSGIGIENTRNRLNLIYGTNYDLTIADSSEKIFNVKLSIPI